MYSKSHKEIRSQIHLLNPAPATWMKYVLFEIPTLVLVKIRDRMTGATMSIWDRTNYEASR